VLKRFISLMIICVLIINIVTLNGSASKKETSNSSVSNVELSKNVNGDITALTYLDGNVFKATYDQNSNTYKLYQDNLAYNVDVSKYDKDVIINVDFDNPSVVDDGDTVTAQTIFVIAPFLWGAASIAAAMQVINAVLFAACAIGTAAVAWYSVDSIAKAIARAEALARTNPKAPKPSAYYRAGLAKGMVVINSLTPISYGAAVAQLRSGLDTFATNNKAAQVAAIGASRAPATAKWDAVHKAEDGYYPHWHPGGVKSIRATLSFTINSNAAPHCWYPAQ